MSEGCWEKLSQVAVKGAQYDSRERQPHPKCLEGTRVVLLNHIYESLDNQRKNQLIWLHGTAGVGKSAVAFTVAERMRGLKVVEGSKEKRLAGTFFFSRKHTKRRTTGYFFATLVYQLASNFPSIRNDVKRTILDNPALLDHDMSLRDQMEALFLQPLQKLQIRLRECPPLTFVIDALDECISESLDEDASKSELADLISLLGEALRDPDLPVTHILLTSRSEEHICIAMRTAEMRPLLCEIPVKTSGEGVAATISLDGIDVDSDICVFLRHSFAKLGTRHPDFPQPSEDQLARLAGRAGRRFIVASTMMKFIDDQQNDPRDRLQLMLKLTSELLPGTEVYKLYDSILFTCADPALAYLHLSVIAALADPLPIAQISKLLGPCEGRDVENVLVQLRSVIDVPTDSNLPVNVYHSSVRDYVSHHSNHSLRQVHDITSPHSLLALSCFRLMAHNLPESTTLPDALSELMKHSQAMESHEPQNLKHALNFTVQPPEPLQVLISLLWLRGHRNLELQFWLDTRDGNAWLQTDEVRDWVQTQDGKDWLATDRGEVWLQRRRRMLWRQTVLQAPNTGRPEQLHTSNISELLQTTDDTLDPPSPTSSTEAGWLDTTGRGEPLQTSGAREWLETQGGKSWLQTLGVREWLQTQEGKDWLQTQAGKYWFQTLGGREWLRTTSGREWLGTDGREWLKTPGGKYWLRSPGGQEWLRSTGGREWLGIGGREWLQTPGGKCWLWSPGGQEWLRTTGGQEWLGIGGREWLQTPGGKDWLQTQEGKDWLQTLGGNDWLQTPQGETWRLTTFWVIMEEFSSMLETTREFIIVPDSPLQPAFQVIQQFKSLPDFLMFPAFLALRHQGHPAFISMYNRPLPDMGTIHAMTTLIDFANQALEQSRSTSDALKYACQNWALHLSRVPNPWDERLTRILESFWTRNLLSWLERQWCLKDLRSCITILCEGEKLALKFL